MKKALIILLAGSAVIASAQIRITEFASGGSLGEYIEITNLGSSSVDFTGWSFDDSSRTAGAFSITSLGIVGAGASAIITEGDAELFRTGWSIAADVHIVGGNNQNLSNGGDEMNIYDASNALVDRLTYPSGTVATISSNGPLSQLGLNNFAGWLQSSVGDSFGSHTSTGGDIGNPGSYNAVPEPATLSVIGLGLAAIVRRRRRA